MPPKEKTALVIGSGVSGLTVASILALRGWKVTVLEAHDRAGGCLHTFTLGDFIFPTGYHYVGCPGADDRRLWRAVSGCDLVPVKEAAVVERYVVRGGVGWRWSHLLPRGPAAWSATHGVPYTRVGAMAGRLRVLIILKLMPYYWMFYVGWCFMRLLFPAAFQDYGAWLGDGVAPMAKLQAVGCLGEEPPAMVGASVARHYVNGTAEMRGSFAKGALMRIRRHGGEVLTRKRVTELLWKGRRAVGARCADGTDYHASVVVSSVGVVGTRRLAPLPELEGLDPGTGHFQLFMGFRDGRELPKYVIWEHHGGKDEPPVFVSFHHQRKGRVAVNVVTPVAPDWSAGPDYEGRKAAMVERLKAVYRRLVPQGPWPPEETTAGGPGTAQTYLGQPHSYGLRVGGRRYRDPAAVWALRPATSVPGLYLTGQDIVTPGIVAALWAGLMTVRQVERVSLWASLRGRDIMDTL